MNVPFTLEPLIPIQTIYNLTPPLSPVPEDPFATTEGSAAIAPELDLFAMRPSDPGSVTPTASAEAPTIVAPTPPPTVTDTTTTATATTTADSTAAAATTTTTESAAAPTLDIFGGKVLSFSLLLLTVRWFPAL